MASVTKPMTALGVVKLAEEGKLNLDAEAREYVPYFPKKKWPVTVRHLLGHLSGISHYHDTDVEIHIKTHHNTRQAIGIFKDWELTAEPGSRFNYSSYGYNLLGAVIEGASGLSFADYMTGHIWRPLNMKSTRMDIADEIIPNRTRGYQLIDGEVKNCEFVDISSRFAAGGILASVVDMLSFARGLDKGKVLSLQAQEKMYESMVTKDKHFTEYGMGWAVDFLSGFWNVSHSGGQAGTSTYLLRFPGENFAAAVAVNLQEHNTQKFVTIIRRAILGAFHLRVETPGLNDDEFQKLHLVWHVGLGYLDRHNKPFSEDGEDLAKSFAYFNNIDARDKLARKKLTDGLYESTGSPLFKIGTYMAQALGKKYGPEKLDDYRRMGAIPFFAAYINLYKKDASIPAKFHFKKKMEKSVNRWNKSWQKTWTDDFKAFSLLPLTELGSVKERIIKAFKGQSAYPRFNITGYARELQTIGELEKGIDLLQLGVELYPKNPAMYYTLGEFRLEKGLHNKALETFKKASTIDKNKENAARYAAWAEDTIRVVEKPVVLPAEILQKYVGDYGPRHITYAKGHLYYRRNGGKKYRLIPLNKNTFALDGMARFRTHFVSDKNGKVTKIAGLYISGNTDESPRDPAAQGSK
jgi:CubicO group peptidase (beta-lactamase class C family)